jgi:hypothetical protein
VSRASTPPSSAGPPPGRPAHEAHPARDFALILLAAALIVALLGIIRLGRQFPAAAASPALLVPFLLPVLALSLEAGALVALSTAQLRQLLRAVPVGPGPPAAPRLAQARATLPLLGMLALVLGAAQLIPRGTEHPGAFANELVQTARASCSADAKVAVPVPLLGLSVSCGEPRRIQGPMPGVRSVQVAMSELTFSDDLRRVDIVGLELTAARALRVHLRAGRARIAGLAPWSRSPRLSPLGRFAILATLGAVLWLVAAFGFRSATPVDEAIRTGGDPPPSVREPPPHRWLSLLAMLLLMVPGAVVAAGFISLDQERAAPPAYAIAALLGLVGLGLVRLLSGRVPRIFSSFRGS